MHMELELVEALCGFHRPISTLDKRVIITTSHPGKYNKSDFPFKDDVTVCLAPLFQKL